MVFMILNALVIVFVTLLLSAFFSGMEIAFISVNKLRIELKSQQGVYWARLLSNYLKSPSRFISTILVGNNLALVLFSVYMGRILDFPINNSLIKFLLVTLISTLIVLISAEFIPKAIFRINPAGILRWLIYPFQFFYFLLYPVVQFTLWLSRSILYLFTRKHFTEESPAFSKMDLDHYITEHQNSDVEDPEIDTEILKNALDFGNLRVRDCMVSRTEIKAIDIQENIQALEALFIETRHSKILVYRDSIDNIIGYVHHIDLYKRPKNIKEILLPIPIANEAKQASELLNEFTQKQRSIALVVDEFGGTAGIVTVEDIVEEIFGEIEDEHDDDDGIIENKIGDNEYEFSARLEVDYLNESYGINIPEGDYDTLGGYIIAHQERIPKEGDMLHIDHFEIKVLQALEQRLEVVRLKFFTD